MIVSICFYLILLVVGILWRKGKVKYLTGRMLFLLLVCNTIAFGMFLLEMLGKELTVTRNSYGEGSRVEKLEVTIPEEGITEKVDVEVFEQEYSGKEVQEMFASVLEELDEVILGENESLDRVEKDLNLVGSLADYPVEIVWELDDYDVMNVEGTIRDENVKEEGTLVEIRGTISYLNERAVYVRHAMVYPLSREGKDKLLYEIRMALQEKEIATRKDATFGLPKEVAGQEVQWKKAENQKGYYVIFLGISMVVFLIYKEIEKEKQKKEDREKVLKKEYPAMVNKLAMLLSTGMTLKHAWKKIVETYESQKEKLGENLLYEEMKITLHEMKGGIPEGEAYERFGKRCGITLYLKFGALLSQNLRKGSRGLSELLRMEALQSFENRKSMAKQEGEEAGTKLLIPMIGMLAVVLIMVMVPAFLTMQ